MGIWKAIFVEAIAPLNGPGNSDPLAARQTSSPRGLPRFPKFAVESGLAFRGRYCLAQDADVFDLRPSQGVYDASVSFRVIVEIVGELR